MPDIPVDRNSGADSGANELLARAAAAELRGHRAVATAIDDFFLPEDARLDERIRTALGALLRGLVSRVEAVVREQARQGLVDRGDPVLADALGMAGPVFDRLAAAGLLRDPELMAEIVGRVRQDALAAALPATAAERPDQPSLLSRFTEDANPALAAAATAVLLAESRRRSGPESGQVQVDLPAELYHRLVWWVAAGLRLGAAERAGARIGALDSALADAAGRCLASYDEGERLEAAALRLAAVIDAQPRELSDLLAQALDDRRIAVFIALVAHALGVDYGCARAVVIDPMGDRLWLVLRAFELPRAAIARIGYALCEADRRDLEAFADALDAVEALDRGAARAALAPLRHHPEYRAALLALETTP